MDALNQIIKSNPNDFGAFVRRGRLYDFNHDYKKAIEDYGKALSVLSLDFTVSDPEKIMRAIDNYNKTASSTAQITKLAVSDLFNFLALSLKRLNQIDDALVNYGKAISVDPTNEIPYNNRGILLMNKGENDLALQDFNKSIELNPSYAIPYCNRGLIKQRKGLRKEAENDFKKAIKNDRKFAEPHNNLAILYHEDKRYKEAIKSYKAAIKLNKKYTIAYFNLGAVYSQVKAYIRSSYYIRKAYKMEPNNPQIRNALGMK
jgi:tetratricopeptide (TPR) repeat protein